MPELLLNMEIQGKIKSPKRSRRGRAPGTLPDSAPFEYDVLRYDVTDSAGVHACGLLKRVE